MAEEKSKPTRLVDSPSPYLQQLIAEDPAAVAGWQHSTSHAWYSAGWAERVEDSEVSAETVGALPVAYVRENALFKERFVCALDQKTVVCALCITHLYKRQRSRHAKVTIAHERPLM